MAYDRELIEDMIEVLVKKFKWLAFTPVMSREARGIYELHLPEIDITKPVYVGDKLLANRITRCVIGDYGAYYEIDSKDIIEKNIHIPSDQRWRLDQKVGKDKKIYKIKYHEYQIEGVKLYYQLDTVKYADYIPEYYYVSVYEVRN